MILVQNHQQQLNGNNFRYCDMRFTLIIFSVLFSIMVLGQTPPEKFITHKVKKKETLYGIARKYNVSIDQINELTRSLKKLV